MVNHVFRGSASGGLLGDEMRMKNSKQKIEALEQTFAMTMYFCFIKEISRTFPSV
jgi:hypothetical protein